LKEREKWSNKLKKFVKVELNKKKKKRKKEEKMLMNKFLKSEMSKRIEMEIIKKVRKK
jgi:hypothetical protein